MGKPGLVRVVVPCPVVDQPAGVRLPAGVAVLRHGAGAADFAAEGVETLGGGDCLSGVGHGQHGTEAVLVIVSRRGGRQVDLPGQSGQRVVEAGVHVDRVRSRPTCAWVFGVQILAVVQILGRGAAFGFLDSSALMVVSVLPGGRAVGHHLIQVLEAVVTVLILTVAGASRVAGSGDRAAAALFALVTGCVVEISLQQSTAEIGLPDFSQLVGRIVGIGGGGGNRVADLLLRPVAQCIVAEGLGLGLCAGLNLGQPVEGVVLVAVVECGLSAEGFLVGFAPSQSVVAVAGLGDDGGGVFVGDLV